LKNSYIYLRPYFLKVPYPSQRAIKDTLDVLAKDIPKAKDADPKDFIVPSMIQGLDIWYQRTKDGRRLTGDRPISLPKMLPSEYFHRQIWISFVDDPLGIKMVGNILDVDKVMFGSDYPHPASTWPDSQKVIGECKRSLSAGAWQKVFRDNARALFDI
jgi:hypothetical protein